MGCGYCCARKVIKYFSVSIIGSHDRQSQKNVEEKTEGKEKKERNRQEEQYEHTSIAVKNKKTQARKKEKKRKKNTSRNFPTKLVLSPLTKIRSDLHMLSKLDEFRSRDVLVLV